jgi:hypothetical protein
MGFDPKILAPEIKELTKAYEIKYDPETSVPADDSLADAVFQGIV